MSNFIKITFTVFVFLIFASIGFAAQDSPIDKVPELPVELLTILSILAPLVVQLVNRYLASKTARTVIAYILSLGIGVAGAFLTGYGDFSNPQNITIFVFAMFGISQFVFKTFWKGLVFGESNSVNKYFKFFTKGAAIKHKVAVED